MVALLVVSSKLNFFFFLYSNSEYNDAWHFESTNMRGGEDRQLLATINRQSVEGIVKEGTKFKSLTTRSKTSVLACKLYATF